MVNAGKPETRVGSDKWTAKTRMGRIRRTFEHCVAVRGERSLGPNPAVTEDLESPAGAPEVLGTVHEQLPSLKWRVELESRQRVIAHAGAATK